jgi:hypothetical protein
VFLNAIFRREPLKMLIGKKFHIIVLLFLLFLTIIEGILVISAVILIEHFLFNLSQNTRLVIFLKV